MLLAAVDFDNLHQVLRVLYDEMMPLCSNMTGVAKGIAGLGALFYVAAKVWQSLARAEPPGADFKSLYFSISLIFRIYTTECQMLIFYEFSSFCWQFRKNVSYLCHSNKSKINETLKVLEYGTL